MNKTRFQKSTLYHMGGVPVGLPLTQGNVIHVKPYYGSNSNNGLSVDQAAKTLLYAHDYLCTADQNDTVLMYAASNTGTYTTDYLLAAAPLVWSNDLTHLIGVGPDPLLSQRTRVAWDSTTSTASNTVMATFSADGCKVENMAFFCGINDANLSFNVLVSGSRNHFKNCHFAGIGHATNDVAGAYSLSVTGSENVFEDCVIGLDTIIRATSTQEAILSGTNNVFINCTFLSFSETTTRFTVSMTATNKWNMFDNCKFICWTRNLATGHTSVFDMPAVASGGDIYLHNCATYGGGSGGIGAAWADTDTNIFVSMPQPHTAGGSSLAAT